MITRRLQKQDLLQSKEIWQESFDDKPAFVDWYFRRRFRPEEGMGIFSGSMLLSNLHLAPYRVRLCGRTFPSAYLVGLATRKQYRRQGLAKELLTFALRSLRESGVFFTFLMPFQIPFYTHLGWDICVQHRFYHLQPEKGSRENLEAVERETSPEPAVLDRVYRSWSLNFNGCLLR